MPKIKTIKTCIIRAELNNANTFKFTIPNIPFTPDELKIKYVSIIDAAPNTGLYLIKTNLVDFNDFIAVANTDSTTQLDLAYQITKPIGGSYDFIITDINGAPLACTCALAIHCEFLKF